MKFWKIGLGIAVLAMVGWFAWTMTRPVPGTKMADQGREHVTPQAVRAFTYNSNPPTSGPHLPTWVKAGVFDAPQSEGELIHSLEHGYIIISYNCNVHLKAFSRQLSPSGFGIRAVSQIYAHEEDGASPSADFVDPTMSTGSAGNNTEGCKALVKNLAALANRKKLWKLIVVPRPELNTTIALTAWNYIDAFDPPAGGFDANRIERFIDYHRDQGPEKTME